MYDWGNLFYFFRCIGRDVEDWLVCSGEVLVDVIDYSLWFVEILWYDLEENGIVDEVVCIWCD